MGGSQKCLRIQEEFVKVSFISFVDMASRIRNNKDIKRLQIAIDEKTHSIKISQLADDTTLFCTFTRVCISVYNVFTQLMKDSLNPKCFRVFSMKFHSKESKAFAKSTKIIAPSILYISA
jgi:hypothetical protein